MTRKSDLIIRQPKEPIVIITLNYLEKMNPVLCSAFIKSWFAGGQGEVLKSCRTYLLNL